ncbi:D-3-phosphoglycerate dehydrogenase [Pseudomonas duriflava]|uniref:D-3-phosphoglycerate dehydrogenase n=1 Tax=Pseudomonas duriflava TaxID=459528 RepID=A0A562QFC7_9PSED|nr:D-2-hydroxyacid dehydrogenase family protein [Pseudomonas duriflava]TWI55462.1 D-3-phosphoglycerate dehydrogenase [Pseudomonas duriflava]
MHIVIPDDYQHVVETLDCFSLLQRAGHTVTVYHDAGQEPSVLIERFREADALVLTRERTRIDDDLLSHLPQLKLVSQTGKATQHLDIAACTRHGVAVVEGTGSPIAAAELTWALILMARRKLKPAIDAFYAGGWQVNLGERLNGQILGIWGYGKIGKLLARYGHAFGMTVLIWGSEASRKAAAADGYRAADSKEAFFAETDVLSLNLRYSDKTRHIVRREDLARMKPSALLVNTARAGLIEPGALLMAVETGHPGYAAVDVYEEEPLSPGHPLLAHPRILCTPHLGYVEKHSYELYFGEAFANLVAFFSGEPVNVANPEVLGR